ncbi:MAG: DUF4040 domain-containing protein [Phycisphaerales bacterium]|nr:DUF4040 domain-containing protein [Phycisphaerales bacterium]
MTLAFDLCLMLLLVALAVWTVMVRDTMSAVTGLMGCGVLLALAWMRLAAPDVALTEAAIGAGLSGLLLIRAAAYEHATEVAEQAPRGTRPGPLATVSVVALCVGVAGLLVFAVLRLPIPAPSLAPQAVEHLEATGLGNAVTAVLFSYRSLDTLLEKAVVVLGLVGIWSIAPDARWKAPVRVAVVDEGPMSLLGRVLPPFGIVLGILLAWNGADDVGGAFPGGTVIAAMWLLALTAGAVRAPSATSGGLRAAVAVGPLVFLAVGVAGFWLADTFLALPPGATAKAWVIVVEVGLTVSIAATMTMLVAGPPGGGATG